MVPGRRVGGVGVRASSRALSVARLASIAGAVQVPLLSYGAGSISGYQDASQLSQNLQPTKEGSVYAANALSTI